MNFTSMTFQNSPQYFNLNFNGFNLSASSLEPTAKRQSLMMHGGARSQEVFLDLRNLLAHHDIGSIAFDCIGHGQSTGKLADSSLKSRTQQALHLLQHLETKIDVCIGVSMGAYNAIQLSKNLQLDALILIVPGVYTPEAYDINFGEQFSEIIRTKNSWIDSDAWKILHDFKGKLLIVSAEHDEVVPNQIPEKLFESASQCAWKHHFIVPKAQHKGIMDYIFNSNELKDEFYLQLKKCLMI